MKTNPNDPVYPTSGHHGSKVTTLTKREHFAALAMQGLLAFGRTDSETDPGFISHHAINCADALILKLNKDVKHGS